jgi:hypothetical protein
MLSRITSQWVLQPTSNTGPGTKLSTPLERGRKAQNSRRQALVKLEQTISFQRSVGVLVATFYLQTRLVLCTVFFWFLRRYQPQPADAAHGIRVDHNNGLVIW